MFVVSFVLGLWNGSGFNFVYPAIFINVDIRRIINRVCEFNEFNEFNVLNEVMEFNIWNNAALGKLKTTSKQTETRVPAFLLAYLSKNNHLLVLRLIPKRIHFSGISFLIVERSTIFPWCQTIPVFGVSKYVMVAVPPHKPLPPPQRH